MLFGCACDAVVSSTFTFSVSIFFTGVPHSGQNKAPSLNGFPQFPQNMVYPPYFLHLTCGFYCNISGLFCKHGKEHCLCQVFVGTFFVFRNSVEKLCVSWALPFIECVAAWALKLPVVSAPLRSLHNRSPPDFLQHIPTYSNPRVTKFFYKITGNQRNCQ